MKDRVMEIRANLFEIERYALNDGPGIRTLLFFKGCPLSCSWCSNPESQRAKTELFYRIDKCLGCRRCIDACPEGVLTYERGVVIDRNRCKGCGACAEACCTEAISLVGNERSIEEVMEIIRRDEDYYFESGGGVTFSGGEPTMQPEVLEEISRRCRRLHYHTAMETCGYFQWERLSEALNYIDLFLFDIKHMDDREHRRLTGISNEGILENYRRLSESGKELIVRFPAIPGINDDKEHIDALGTFLGEVSPGCRIDVLPYHRLGISKYRSLQMEYTLQDLELQKENTIAAIVVGLQKKGLQVRVEK